MKINCVWEHNGNDTLLYAVDYVGAYTRGENLEKAPLTMEEYEKLKNLTLKSAKYGQVPRTADEMYEHTKNVTEYNHSTKILPSQDYPVAAFLHNYSASNIRFVSCQIPAVAFDDLGDTAMIGIDDYIESQEKSELHNLWRMIKDEE